MLRRPAAYQVIVILLGGLVAGCDQTPEYRIAGWMAGLQPGAIVVARGQVVGDVLSVEHRGETTFVRVNIDRKAAPLRAGDAVRTRRIGLGHQLVLEVVPLRHAGSAIAPGAWLQLAPPAPDRPSNSPSRRRQLEPRDQRTPPYQLLPPGPPPRRSRPVPVSLHAA